MVDHLTLAGTETPHGRRLKALRFARGLSVRRLSREMRRVAADQRVTLPGDDSLRRMILAWEGGQRMPSLLYADLLCRLFDLTSPVEEILSTLDDRQWLRRERIQRRWTVPQVISRMRRVCAEAGVILPDNSSLTRSFAAWQTGTRNPSPFYAEVLRRVFGHPRPEDCIYPTDLRLLREVGL
ncbi:helix-turn-helix transcriptional regulator [Micromonospora sp. NPDC047465]|uniref:helix-turn-helix transcriptional regulator n=1 Tax=Micromonospora sp. NPDC047465 TaxID=3154813 RepID=UPI0033F1EE38